MPAGDFSKSLLPVIKRKAEKFWADGQFKTDFMPESETAKAILSKQNAVVKEITDPDKDHDVQISWIIGGDMEIRDESAACALDEPETETDKKDYTLSVKKETGFKIDLEKLRTNTYEQEDIMARKQLEALKVMDEYVAKTCVAKLKTFASINSAPNGFTYEDGTTKIPASEYNKKLMAYFIKVARQNKILNPYLIDGGDLFIDFKNAQFDAGNGEGKGDASRILALDSYFDLFNFAAAEVEESTFMIAKASVALAAKARYSDTPTPRHGGDQVIYKIPSLTLPGIYYDVVFEESCSVPEGSTREHTYLNFRYRTQFDVLANPSAVGVGKTGVLSFTRVADPVQA